MAKLSSTQIYGDLQVDGEIKNKASTTSEGVVQLNDDVNSTSTTQGATANAVKKVNDSLSSHKTDTTSHITASERTTWNGKLDKSGGSISGALSVSGAITAPSMGVDGTMNVIPQYNNEVNFGGTNNSSTIYFGYRANGSKPIPSTFVFGSSSGTSLVKAKNFQSTTTTGTAPFTVASTTVVSNLNADMLDGLHSSSFTKRVSLTGQCQQTSYRRSVIALCKTAGANSSFSSYSIGTLSFHRDNGLSGAVMVDVTIESQYGGDGYINSTIIDNSFSEQLNGGIRPCTFTYNGVNYGGVEIYIAAAQLSYIEFNGATNFDIFALDYYSVNTSTSLNDEINNSISFDKVTNRGKFRFNGNKVYHEGNKPTPTNIGALASTGGTLTGRLTVKTASPTGIELIPTDNIEGKGAEIVFGSTDNQHVRIRANHYDSIRAPFGFHLEKCSPNTQTGKAYLEVEGDIFANGGNKVYHVGNKPTLDDIGAVGRKGAGTGSVILNDPESCVASGDYAVAEGGNNKAIGMCSHVEGVSCTAESACSHAEGLSTKAMGNYAHAEGGITTASGQASHSEGENTTASGLGSHAEGSYSTASGNYSHAEGYKTTASGSYSHAEGGNTIVTGNNSHAEGTYSKAYSSACHAEGISCTAGIEGISTEYGAHAEGYCTVANGRYAHAEGESTTSSSTGSHAEGRSTISKGLGSHAEGYKTTASGSYSHAEGTSCTASGPNSHAKGYYTKATSDYSYAEGYYTQATSTGSHAEGYQTKATGNFSHSSGYYTTAETYGIHVQGRCNKVNAGSATAHSATHNAFVIGNGTSTSITSNAFRVNYSGQVYGLSAFNSTGADYAEYFEWLDGNPNNEDRIGLFVTLDGEKIRLANSKDDYIIGIISGNQSIIGNACEDGWNDMYLRDEFGRLQYEDIEVEREVDLFNEDTNEIEKVMQKVTEKHIKLNPNYDPSVEYKPRSERKEWGIVGMLGQIIVKDDGTCKVNGYCKPSENGIATASDNKAHYRVMSRISDNLIKVIMR